MLACHDLRTPLATVHGFAHTLARVEGLDETSSRYVEMITSASGQMAELIDELSVAARLAAGRYDPPLRAVDTLELARAAAERLGDERVGVAGEGAELELDADAVERAVAALSLTPVTPASAPVLLGEDLRDLGAAVAGLVIQARGGSVALDGEALKVRLA